MKTTTNTVKTNNTNMEGMTMTINEYANQIAANVIGATVNEVEKANGVILTAVTFGTGRENIRASFYVDALYKDGVSVEDATAKLQEVIERERDRNINVDFIDDFERVRPMLRARLYNKITNAEVFRSAAVYGFEDLIIVPYITGVDIGNGRGAIKVTSALVNKWDVTVDEVLDIAEENSRADVVLTSMEEILASMGYPMPPMSADAPTMLVCTSKDKTYGAYAVIASMDAIRARFKGAFTVLPSSVHEVIIVDANDPAAMSAMVQEVNDTQVDPEEQLSNHAYTFAA